MKRRELIKSLAMAAIGTSAFLATSGQASAKDAVPSPLLSVGESMHYDDGLKITFIGVKNDSRCPMGALCIWAGDAEVLLRARVGNQPPKIISVHTNLKPRVVVLSAVPPGMIGIPKSYSIWIGELTPRPKIGKKLKQSDYRLSLSISVAV
ncbi:MAG: hypothetical protein ABIT37_15250 [Luteolibacter sp.]